MNTSSLDAAIAEAERFLVRAKTLRQTVRAQRDAVQRIAGHDASIYSHPVEQGAVRRASMDLTRSLAALRRREGA